MKPIVTFLGGLLLVMAFQTGYRLLARIFRNRMHLEKFEWAALFWIMTLVLLATCDIFHSGDPKDIILWTPMALIAVIHVFVLMNSTEDIFFPSDVKTFVDPDKARDKGEIKYHGVHPRKRPLDSKISSQCSSLNRNNRGNRMKPIS